MSENPARDTYESDRRRYWIDYAATRGVTLRPELIAFNMAETTIDGVSPYEWIDRQVSDGIAAIPGYWASFNEDRQ